MKTARKKAERGEAFLGFVIALTIGSIYHATVAYIHDKGEQPPAYEEIMGEEDPYAGIPFTEGEHRLYQMPNKNETPNRTK